MFKGKWTYNCGGGGMFISGGAHKRQFTVGIALSSPFTDVCCNLLKILGFCSVAEVFSCKEERLASAKGQSSFFVRNSSNTSQKFSKCLKK